MKRSCEFPGSGFNITWNETMEKKNIIQVVFGKQNKETRA